LAPEAAIPPPSIQVFSRRVEFDATTVGFWDDDPDDAPFQPGSLPIDTHQFYRGGCEVSPLDRVDEVMIIAGWSPENPPIRVLNPPICVGNELSIKLKAICTLLDNNDDVSVRLESHFSEGYAGDKCRDEDYDDNDSKEVTLSDCGGGCTQTEVSMSLRNRDGWEPDDSHGYVKTLMRNIQGNLVSDLPNVQAENRRKVTLSGEVTIHDDGNLFEDDMEETFVLFKECLVDPFAREDQFSWSECARDEDGDGEVRLEVKGRCELGRDHQSVNIKLKATLFEGATCVSDENNGSRDRDFLTPGAQGAK
jgi:hypothetical protein